MASLDRCEALLGELAGLVEPHGEGDSTLDIQKGDRILLELMADNENAIRQYDEARSSFFEKKKSLEQVTLKRHNAAYEQSVHFAEIDRCHAFWFVLSVPLLDLFPLSLAPTESNVPQSAEDALLQAEADLQLRKLSDFARAGVQCVHFNTVRLLQSRGPAPSLTRSRRRTPLRDGGKSK